VIVAAGDAVDLHLLEEQLLGEGAPQGRGIGAERELVGRGLGHGNLRQAAYAERPRKAIR
jgi:hypothetical protein